METAKITGKGQITIPKKVREKMAIGSGDRLAFDLDDQGNLHVTPVRKTLKPLRGFLAECATGEKLDGKQIRKALRQRAMKKYGDK
jgi:antitoxin PrlF